MHSIYIFQIQVIMVALNTLLHLHICEKTLPRNRTKIKCCVRKTGTTEKSHAYKFVYFGESEMTQKTKDYLCVFYQP